MQEHRVRRADGGAVRVLELRRSHRDATPAPALIWLHGGGYVIGTPEIDMALLARILNAMDVAIFSVDYRLAPRHPFPAALEDAAAVLRWATDRPDAIGIDRRRIAIGGNSAGGGLAAGLAQRAYDEGIALAFQLLMYPMLDDRTATRRDHARRGKLVWTPRSNRDAWTAYLGTAPGAAAAPAYAAPARRSDLNGLAPTWIGVGALDLFYEEDVAYAERLRAAGVPCAFSVVEGAPHAFDILNLEVPVVQEFHRGMTAALANALQVTDEA